MEASREFKKTETSSTQLQLWQSKLDLAKQDSLSLSPEGVNLLEKDAPQSQQTELIADLEQVPDELDLHLSDEDKLKIRLLEELISWMTGKTFKFSHIGLRRAANSSEQDSANVSTGTAQNVQSLRGWGMHYRKVVTKHESEKMTFSAGGTVKDSTGKEIHFDLNLMMKREKYESRVTDVQLGQALIDPIVIQTDHIPPGLSDQKIRFDLDLDGELDDVSVPRDGSGFLVYDRNDNGLIDDGSELFGPSTNHGFSELRELDDDHNGWLDENDLAFDKLQIWSMNASGQMELSGLLDSDVGAIYLGSASTEYTLTDSEFNENGQLRESGIYLKESGGVSSIHELDIRV
jgi:hypothetical protein